MNGLRTHFAKFVGSKGAVNEVGGNSLSRKNWIGSGANCLWRQYVVVKNPGKCSEDAFNPFRQKKLLEPNRIRQLRECNAGVAFAIKAESEKLEPLGPTTRQLWLHAMRAGIPMIGFGFIDNLVMITAGERIESSIGVTLGLTTLAAAGLGQIVSDISGICCGGTVDALVGKLLPNMPQARLTLAQKELTAARLAQTFGGCVGVTIGCLAGMSCLFFIDHEALERQKTAAELEKIFDIVEMSAMNTADRVVGAEMSILWMVDTENDNDVWTRVVADGDVATDIEIKKTDYVSMVKKLDSSKDIVERTIRTGKLQRHDVKDKGPVKSMMASPIISGEKCLGVIQMINKRDAEDGSITPFNKTDAAVLRVLCAHIASFLEIVETYHDP